MTNNLIGVLVDRSGSMGSCREDMEGGLASLLEKQAEESRKTMVTLAQFDTVYDIVYGPTMISDVPRYSLHPRGGTALLDGMGRFITEVGESLAAMKEHKRPERVLIVIITDGYENSSKEWTRERVRELIAQQRNVYSWEFVFLGANIDAMAEAQSFGIQRGSAMTFATANAGATMDSLNSYVSSYNTTGAAAFTPEDRENAVEPSTP
jgi:Mg-chelatase subunit ChlD